MKIGQVLAQERIRRDLKATDVASQLGLSLADYEILEAGELTQFEAAASQIALFNDLIQGQVNQLFYPCGLPFTQVKSYSVK